MSTPAATARYIIAADDKTKAAISSVRNGFKSMESNIKATVSRINLAFSLIAGAGLKRTLQSVFMETAKGSKEFASALDDVRRAARNLLAAKEGAPAAAAAMRELSAVLKDPEFVAAADKIASLLIRGFVGTVKFATGVKTLREEIEELKKQRDALATQENQPRTYIKGEPTFTSRSDQVYGKTLQIEAKERELMKREAAEARRLAENQSRIDSAAGVASRRFNTMREFEQNIKFFEELEKKRMEGAAGDTEYWENARREAELTAIKMRELFSEDTAKDAGDVGETLDRSGDSLDQFGDRIGKNINKMSEWSVAADQAARNIQDAFADFLFDPFEDGLKGMLRGFIDVVRRMAAEMAAAKIFGSKESGGLGGADLISSFFGGLFGGSAPAAASGAASGFSGPRAIGGPVGAGKLYSVNEREMEFFRPNQSGEVIPLSKMRGGGSPNISITTHIDARGATMELTRALPEVLRRNNEQLKADIITGLRRGKYQV